MHTFRSKPLLRKFAKSTTKVNYDYELEFKRSIIQSLACVKKLMNFVDWMKYNALIFINWIISLVCRNFVQRMITYYRIAYLKRLKSVIFDLVISLSRFSEYFRIKSTILVYNVLIRFSNLWSPFNLLIAIYLLNIIPIYLLFLIEFIITCWMLLWRSKMSFWRFCYAFKVDDHFDSIFRGFCYSIINMLKWVFRLKIFYYN